MKAKQLLWVVNLLGFSAIASAQLTDSFEVISAQTSLPPAIQNDSGDIALSKNPEVLISQRRYKEAANFYSRQISDNHLSWMKAAKACFAYSRSPTNSTTIRMLSMNARLERLTCCSEKPIGRRCS